MNYPNIDPVAISFGSYEVHWYGLMYLVAFGGGWWLGVLRTKRNGTEWRKAEISDLLFYFALGAIIGGRAGYTVMYNFSGFIAEPLVIFKIWQGGMSYHGGMVGVFVAMWLYARHTGRTFFRVSDYLADNVSVAVLPRSSGHRCDRAGRKRLLHGQRDIFATISAPDRSRYILPGDVRPRQEHLPGIPARWV